MFYKTNIDITNDKQMFNFLKDHFRYATMNSWNDVYSIANNVKVYKLGLTGDCWTALNLLHHGEYDTLNWMIKDWEREHPGYVVGFNGRSGGYLVLYNKDNRGDVLPHSITDNDDYTQYKDWCRYYGYTVKENRFELQMFTKLVRDFDRLCDELREYVDELSHIDFEREMLESLVEEFNERYAEDLEYLKIEPLSLSPDEEYLDITPITVLTSLFEAFTSLATHRDLKLVFAHPNRVKLTQS